MAEPEADRRDIDEAKEAFGGLVVAGGDTASVLELVEAPLDKVPQPVEPAIDSDTEPARLAHRDHRQDATRLHGFANLVGVIAAIGQQDARLRQVVVHDQIKAQVVRCLARRDVRPHWQPGSIDAQVDLGRETTS